MGGGGAKGATAFMQSIKSRLAYVFSGGIVYNTVGAIFVHWGGICPKELVWRTFSHVGFVHGVLFGHPAVQ